MKSVLIGTCLIFVALAAACGGRSLETTPEMAQSLLKARGFNFTQDEFFKALRQSESSDVALFLQAGMDPNVRNEKGETALTFAAANSNVETVKVLAAKADLNIKDGADNMPLFVALKKQKYDNFDHLLSAGADPNSTGTAGNTKKQSVLYVAILQNRMANIKKLIEKGADPDQPDADGAVPISEHAIAPLADLEVVKLLLSKTRNINIPEGDGSTVLMYAAGNTKMPRSDLKEIIRLLLEKGADKSMKDKDGKTALDRAKKAKNTEAIELLQ